MGSRKIRVTTEGCGRDLFIKHFGKPIDEFETYKRATGGLAQKTIGQCRRVFCHYFLFLDQDPDAVIKQRKLDIVAADVSVAENYERLTAMYVKNMLERNLAGKTVRSNLGRVQGFFTNNGKRLSLDMPRMKIPKARRRKKYSPSNEEVRQLFNIADSARDKLIIALMYQHGPAPKDVCSLTCGDYPLEPWTYFEFNRSKTGEIWRGVSTPDVCDCLKQHLTVLGHYEKSDSLFVGREGPLESAGISQIVHELIIKANLNTDCSFKPTSLRDAFEDALVECEIYHKIKEALMAHNSGIEQEYGGINRMVSKLTEAMKKVYPLLCLNDALRNDNSVILTVEAYEKLKTLLENYDEIIGIVKLVKEKKYVHIHDPDLIPRLKAEGLIK